MACAPATEHEQMPAVRIALERLLHQQRQAIKPLAHVGVTGRQPNPRAARDRDHRRRRCAFASAAIIALTIEASTGPVIRIRAPVANSTSIAPCGASCDAAPGAGTTVTAENVGLDWGGSQSCCRHRNN